MTIFIVVMDDPIQTKSFIKKIIEERWKDIVGIAIVKGNRLTIAKNKSKYKIIIIIPF